MQAVKLCPLQKQEDSDTSRKVVNKLKLPWMSTEDMPSGAQPWAQAARQPHVVNKQSPGEDRDTDAPPGIFSILGLGTLVWPKVVEWLGQSLALFSLPRRT